MRQLYHRLTTNQPTNTVKARETECAACHGCNAAGSSSRQAVKQGSREQGSIVGKPEGATPRLKLVLKLK